MKKKIMNRKRPHEGTEDSVYKTDLKRSTYISREVLLKITGLPVIRGFKKLRFLMTDKTVKYVP